MSNNDNYKNKWDDLFGNGSLVVIAKEFIPPKTWIEAELAKLWQEVLKFDKVSTDDNFLDLGGNSLLIIQLMAKIADVFYISLTFKEILSTKLTIAEQAGIIENALIGQTNAETLDELMKEVDNMSDEEVNELRKYN
jgi:acyl carrier protein